MEGRMKWSFWSDEDRWFVPRAFGLGYSLNLKYVAKRLGWIKPTSGETPAAEHDRTEPPTDVSSTREERLRERIESSKYEDVR
jgi:hypothetical protein